MQRDILDFQPCERQKPHSNCRSCWNAARLGDLPTERLNRECYVVVNVSHVEVGDPVCMFLGARAYEVRALGKSSTALAHCTHSSELATTHPKNPPPTLALALSQPFYPF